MAVGAAAQGFDLELVAFARRGRSFDAVTAEALALVDGAVRLLGVSGGGPFALAAAVAGGDRVERLTIVSGMPPPEHGIGPLASAAGLDEDGLHTWAVDLLTPLGAPELAGAIPGARLVEWADGGHFAQLFHAADVYEAL